MDRNVEYILEVARCGGISPEQRKICLSRRLL